MELERDEDVSILHPLATLHWEECQPLPINMQYAQCVVLHGKLHVGGGYSPEDAAQLCVSSIHPIKWSAYTTPTSHYALTTYHSQLVLVGGEETATGAITNKLWTSDTGMAWKESLPPMPTARRGSSAANIGTGEHQIVVVAGGMRVNVVEVFTNGEWCAVQELPRECWNLQSTLHNGKLYLMGGFLQYDMVYFCDVASLLVWCQQSHGNKSSSLWRKFKVSLEFSSPASFGGHLVSIGGLTDHYDYSPDIVARSPLNPVWVPIGKVPTALRSAASIVLPTGDLLVIGGDADRSLKTVFKASISVSPYDPDSVFSMSSLLRLEEGAGIKVVSALGEIPRKLAFFSGVHIDEHMEMKLTKAESKIECVEIIISRWKENSQHPSTWRSLWDVLREINLTDLSQELEDYMLGKLEYLSAYRQILATRDSLDMWFIKVVLLGAPRLGKTTVRRRLTGEIADISSSGESVQPSTGAVESAPSVVIRNLSSTMALVTPSEWAVSEDLTDEAHMILQFFHNHTRKKEVVMSQNASGEATTHAIAEASAADGSSAAIVSSKISHSPDFEDQSDSSVTPPVPASARQEHRKKSQLQSMSEVAELFRSAVGPKYWRDIQHLFKDTAYVKMEDTGGQPEFMDMLSALTIGPALYLLFCRLIDDLYSQYTVSYLSPSGESTTPVKSTYTLEEVILSALASVSSTKSYSSFASVHEEDSTSSTEEQLLASCNEAVAYIVGTHKDLVSEQQIAEFDEKLQKSIRSTDFFKEDLVQFSSEDRMVLPIDNMNGGEEEIKKVRKFLEEGMKKHFKKLSIPAAWLVLSLCLRKREERTASLQSVLQLAGDLGMSERETKLALWFLHHYAGVLMYFPMLAELKDTVICDTQVVYDSASNLIVNTFRFGKVGKAASERFRKTGQFSLEDIKGATESVSGDYIPLQKLVKLLEHLNIIAVITPSTPTQATSPHRPSVTYFMPCILENATREELEKWWDSNSSLPSPLFIRYKCGYIPIGVFPAMITHLASNNSLKLIVKNIKKNRVQFQMLEGDCETVTLVSQPKYYAIHVTRDSMAETPTHEVCSTVRGLVESTLKIVTSCMNYSFNAEYQLSFECPTHPGRGHLCTVTSGATSHRFMFCLNDADCPQRVQMKNSQLVWFKQCSLEADSTAIKTALPIRRGESSSSEGSSLVHTKLSLPAALGDTPHLDQLLRHKIIDRVAAKWKHFALVGLHFPSYMVDNIECDIVPLRCVDCCLEAFRRWLDGVGRSPNTWEALLQALRDADKAELASELEQVFN